MPIGSKLMMLAVNVADMPKAKEFYVKKLGFEITTEYRQDDNNWWVTVAAPQGDTVITLSRASVAPTNVAAGTLSLYFEADDINTSHVSAKEAGLEVDDIQDDLFGPGSGVKWFSIADPDGNQVMFAEKHDARAPF